ncbi:ribonuclease CL2-like [Apteryx mantelli]|uniref:Ribonuclease A-domain domain-containing protein n=2 Tax=Apteryx TaxID=8821 RepID=A0A8B9NWD8_APTOW|nr:PREDICTED: ribonuclease CL2-like [Apteryx mantelli mantelli]XP_013806666.1 PREDICTED: ribonuclease CL2-like [Apteryx mantelli mantelli]XP_025938702.1 ribonuclease CL2-like [Apteryx rowi]XP_025938711.1 ribonuclease CL2-like [Apteryx rowi]
MAMRSSLWLMLALALALLVSVGAQETRYQKFLRQHVDYPRTPGLVGARYCNILLMRRAVNGPGRPCKPVNTFVHAPAKQLLSVCAQQPDGLHVTVGTLPVTACRLVGGNVRPPCTYRASQLNHRVQVACQNGRPVHLDRTF